jgi:hypothetical protein
MSISKWIKENVFDWSAQPPSRATRPPAHDPGWANRQRAKRANYAPSWRCPSCGGLNDVHHTGCKVIRGRINRRSRKP